MYLINDKDKEKLDDLVGVNTGDDTTTIGLINGEGLLQKNSSMMIWWD